MSLQRKTPLRSKRATPRRLPPVRCSFQRCSTRPYVEGMCKTHATREAFRLRSLIVRARDRRCVARDFFPEVSCAGELQDMHLVRRTFHAIAWDPANGAAGCKAHHRFLTLNPDEHYEFCERLLGVEGYAALRERRRGEPPYLGDVLVELRGQVAA